MTEDCSYCSCSMTAVDSYCSCDRSIIYVLDLATPRFEIVVGQPPSPLDCGILSSKRSSRVYKSMIAVGEPDAARKRFTASAESLPRSSADYHCGHAPAIPQEQSSREEVLPGADRHSSGTHCPQALTDLQATHPKAPDLRATDRQVPDFCTIESPDDLQLHESNFRATYDPPVVPKSYATDFFAVITPNASDDFDAVDLTAGDDYRVLQRSVDLDGWEERVPADSAHARSLENGTWDARLQASAAGDARKDEESSLWTRCKNYISRGLCCRQRSV
ncbi:hypothetical protein ACI65C_010935 [Semiaphis heraclei]